MKTKIFSTLLIALSLHVHGQEAPKPFGAIPSERQLKWHEMELYTLIHYTPTTFQDKEWGLGDADPKIFNPHSFDASQIAKAAASGGFKGLISVAKHHDGFCLWPTATTSYSIASSPWKNGKGDMVKEFMEASHAAGLDFGVYLSAWDRNDDRYGSPAYAEAYRAQLTELMSNYGPLFTSWHDGANGGDGFYGGKYEKRTIDRSTYYSWHDKTWPIVRKLQPMAMIFSDVGLDMRWVGNEKGFAAETSWATITPKSKEGRTPVPGDVDESNLSTGDRHGKYWIPAECDVPQRPGWFYHENQNDRVKTPDQLFEIYLKSVGRGGNMNLGLAPMPEGILHDNDVKSLAAFGEKVKNTFAVNYAKGAHITASNVRANHPNFGVQHILDEDRYSYYASDDDVSNPTLEITLNGEQSFDIIRLRENIKLGQRLDSIRVDIWENGKWEKLAEATSIGATRLIKLDQPAKASKLRVQLFAPVAPTLSDFALFTEAKSDFSFDKVERKTVSSKNIKIASQKVSSLAFDGDNKTIWETQLKRNSGIDLSFNTPETVTGIQYLPRQDGKLSGIPTKYSVETSLDGKQWTAVVSGEFSNIKANPTLQYIRFIQPIETRFLRFIPLENLSNDTSFSVAEFEIFKK